MSNFTASKHLTVEVKEMKLEPLSDEVALRIATTLMLTATPIISVLGVVGNSFSIIILFKHGLRKSSNILLLVLAVADMSYLVSFNSIPKLVYKIHGRGSFRFTESSSRIWFVFFCIFRVVDYAMCYISLSLPAFITVERLIAVFFPLRFPRIVTSRRTWVAAGILCAFWCTYHTYTAFWFSLRFDYDAARNASVGRLGVSHLYYQDLPRRKQVEKVFGSLGFTCSSLFTFVGCLIISVKIRIVSNKRKKMTLSSSSSLSSSVKATSQTTRTLLAVCFVYLLTSAVLAIPMIPWVIEHIHVLNAFQVVYQMSNILLCINSSFNFIVYIGLNKNFRNTFRSLFGCLGVRIAERRQK